MPSDCPAWIVRAMISETSCTAFNWMRKIRRLFSSFARKLVSASRKAASISNAREERHEAAQFQQTLAFAQVEFLEIDHSGAGDFGVFGVDRVLQRARWRASAFRRTRRAGKKR